MPVMEARHIALKFQAPIDMEEQLQGFMMMHATINGIEEAADGSIVYYIPGEEWSRALDREIQEFLALYPEASFLGFEEIEERDWNAEWEASITPQRITEALVITPSWKLQEARALTSKYLITIDPKMSFGTGHHETTRLCLTAIETLDIGGQQVLDIGTGSGILAIYALERGARHAVGIDTDHWSIENVRENRTLNGLSEHELEIRQGTLGSSVRPEEYFDLVLANIHRNVLLDIAGDIRAHCSDGCSIILSGLLIYDMDEVRSAYEADGFTFVRDFQENEWSCLMFEFSPA